MSTDPFKTLRDFEASPGRKGTFHSLHALEEAGIGPVSRLPVSLRIVLESVLRNCDGKKVTESHVRRLASWKPSARRTEEIPFVVSRILLQDFTGVPLLCDLAAMRGAVKRTGGDPRIIEPLVPVDLIIDHSVQIDHYGSSDALRKNLEREFDRNRERYEFLKWGMQAFKTFRVVPPGIGICHQVNLEHLARGVHERGGLFFPDTLVGTDSHTTMINSIGVAGWGVGGIEAEAAMLGQPLYFLTPDVVGVNITGRLSEGVTATDLVLTITELLRREKVVGAFVEFFGAGSAALTVPDRATISNMSPEYGATMGFFPVDEATLDYFRSTGRTTAETAALESYFRAQGMFGMPKAGSVDYTRVIEFDIASVVPSVAGPRRPQDRIELPRLKDRFADLLLQPASEGGFSRQEQERRKLVTARKGVDLCHGDVIIAAITSCTNTSNPSVLIAAGLLAKKAAEKGLRVGPKVKTSLAPGSRVVTEYLRRAGLLSSLEQLGFHVAAYGCTTCIGNSGPLDDDIEQAIVRNDLVCAAVLSGNRNFEARIHPNLRANFLMSPALVIAFALAGTMLWDPGTDPLGTDHEGNKVFLRDIMPGDSEVSALMRLATDPGTYQRLYTDPGRDNELWNRIASPPSDVYTWRRSHYIAEPPFLTDFAMHPVAAGDILGARCLGIFGDSLTTDHISPAGSIKETTPAGQYLIRNGIAKADFQSYGTRRGNHEIMVRGTFANVRIRNLMVPAGPGGSRVEGGITVHHPSGERISIYDAATRYQAEGIPTIVFGGEEYGTGSSRDWAAKGTKLLGVRAVVARSFERIHRANLVGMGVLPLQFSGDGSVASLDIRGDEVFDIRGLDDLRPQQELTLAITSPDGPRRTFPLRSRIDTQIEVDYYRHGGILPFVLRELLSPR